MVPPSFSAWSSFILGGLGGLRNGGERPPWAGPPGGAVVHGPPGRLSGHEAPGEPPISNLSNGRPPLPFPDGGSLGPEGTPTAFATESTSNCSTYGPTAIAQPEHLSNHSVPSTTNHSMTDCTLFNSPLTNAEQVGKSIYGTLCQPPLPLWLDRPDGTKYPAPPWGNVTTNVTDPTLHAYVPETNVTRSYNWTLSRSRLSPDGVLRDVLLVNDQFPGPLIEANFGDFIEVHVTNNVSAPEEGTALHWHGLLQRETPWMDGTPGVAQCPIAPGESYTYRFRAELYGTTFWHAHYSAQYTAGATGPIVIHGPTVREYDIDLGPIMLSDWNHIPYFSMVANVVGTDFSKIPPLSDNALINGRGRFNCSTPSYSNSSDWLGSYFNSDLQWTCVDDAPRAKFGFQSGKTHLLRLINHGADGIQKFSIDNHTMTVIATDFVPTQPYETSIVTLGVGQRTDLLVTAHQNRKAAVWMRTQLPGGPKCGGLGPYGAPIPPLGAPMPPDTIYPDVLAAIYYEDAETSIDPVSTTSLEPISCENDDLTLTRPVAAIKPGQEPYVLDLVMTLALNETGNFEWQTNGQAYRANFNEPLLYDVKAGRTSFPENPEWNVYNLAENRSVVLNVTNRTPFTHPMHLHGHSYFVLSVGRDGTVWDGSTVNPDNPMRRDVQIIPAGGHAAIQLEGDNPGVWPFHCHAAWHLSSGLAVNLVSRPEEVMKMDIPEGTREATCATWDRYSSGTVVDQIDSGS